MGVSAVVAAVADAVTSVTVADVLTGAAVGGLVSGVTGGNILQGAAMGGLGGALSDIGGSLYNSATGVGAAGGTGINLANAPSGGPGIDYGNVPTGGAGITGNAFGNGVGQLGGVLGGAGATGISASAIPTPGLDASTAGMFCFSRSTTAALTVLCSVTTMSRSMWKPMCSPCCATGFWSAWPKERPATARYRVIWKVCRAPGRIKIFTRIAVLPCLPKGR